MGIVFDEEKQLSREYELVCKVKVVHRGHRDWKERQMSFDAVYLIPKDSSDRTRFFMAYLPDTQEERSEVVGYLHNGIDSPCRFALMRGNNWCSENHLFVMTKAMEDVLKRVGDKDLRLTILPASDDEEADRVQTDADIRPVDFIID